MTKDDVKGLIKALKHGDEDHQKWLEEAITAYYENKPIPEVKGGSAKDKRIEELEEENENLKYQLSDKRQDL